MRICVFIGDMYRDYSLAIIRNLDAYAKEHGHIIDVFGNCSLPSSNPLHVIGFKSILSLPQFNKYDGIILCYDTLNHEGMAKELVEDLLADPEAPPVVCVRAEIAGFFNVIPDNRAIMHEIAQFVISKCKSGDIGFVTGRDDLIDSAERRAGFEDAMHEAGYEVTEDLIFHGNYWITQGPETADFFIREDKSLPEAIICSNDYMAIALIDELMSRGYSIPEDVMVSGVDNSTEATEHIPSITTIEISEKELAYSAMEILEKLKNKEQPDILINVPGKLILRESTGDQESGRDIYEVLHDLKLFKTNSVETMREYVVLSAVFEGALTIDAAIEVALANLKEIESVRSCFICRYCETDRELIGRFVNRGDINTENMSFPNENLLPDDLKDNEDDTFIFFPLSYKNEVYGYAVFVVDTEMPNFINQKIEYVLTQLGQSINRLELYQKFFGIADIMSLYIRDTLTGMYNRRGFEKKMSEMFDADGNPVSNLTVVSVDMDGLKYINDTFGHTSGDEAIKAIGRCIDNALKAGEFVARTGGDEFVAVLIHSDPGRVGQFIRNVRNSIKEFNAQGKYPFEISASIGTCPLTCWNEVMECMNKADKAMYLEKKAKKKNR